MSDYIATAKVRPYIIQSPESHGEKISQPSHCIPPHIPRVSRFLIEVRNILIKEQTMEQYYR